MPLLQHRAFLILLPILASMPSVCGAASDLVLGQRAIARAEVTAFVKTQFAEMDRNHDGLVDQAEFEAYRAHQPAQPPGTKTLGHIGSRWMEKTDANGDGRVSLAEAEERPLEMFDMGDINRDGIVSVEEQSMAALFMK